LASYQRELYLQMKSNANGKRKIRREGQAKIQMLFRSPGGPGRTLRRQKSGAFSGKAPPDAEIRKLEAALSPRVLPYP
jgi:hypothetical protein